MTEKEEGYAAVHGELLSTSKEFDPHQSMTLFRELSAPISPNALKTDDSRGFALTSIKAAFILERLTEAFGLLGYGWRYAHSRHHVEDSGGRNEVLVEVALQWRLLLSSADGEACPPVNWHPAGGWCYPEGHPSVWSEPIYTSGGSNLTNRAGSTPYTDAARGATTNGLTKAAARLGVGLEVFKGQNAAPPVTQRKRRTSRAKAKDKAPAPAPAPASKPANAKDEVLFLTLGTMQKAAESAVGLLEFEDKEVDPKTMEVLAHQMKRLGLKMQPVRLVHLLLGENAELYQKSVMGAYNFLLAAKLGADAVDLLNAAA